MKKLLLVFLSLILLVNVAFAEEAVEADPEALTPEEVMDEFDEEDYEEEEPAPEPDLFSGTWLDGKYAVEIDWEGIGYRILVSLANTPSEFTEWEYSGFYYEEEKTIVTMPFGMKTEVIYGEDGTAESWTTVYEDGSAIFGLNEEGKLIWNDEKEHAGDGLAFVKVEEFAGIALQVLGELFAEGTHEGLTEEEQASLFQAFMDEINTEVDSKISCESLLQELEDAEIDEETLNQLLELKESFDQLQEETNVEADS
jgi:hypothetical protein